MADNPIDTRIQKQKMMAAQSHMLEPGLAQQLKAGEGDKKAPGRFSRIKESKVGQAVGRFGKGVWARTPGTDAKAKRLSKIQADSTAKAVETVLEDQRKKGGTQQPAEAEAEQEGQAPVSVVRGKQAIAASDMMTKFDHAFKEALRRGQKKSKAKKKEEDITSDMAIRIAVCRKEFREAVLAGTAATPMEDISDAYEENMWPVRVRLAAKLKSGRIDDLSKQELDIIYSTMLGMKYEETRVERNARRGTGAPTPQKLFWNDESWPESNGPTPPQAFFMFLETVAKRTHAGNEAVFISQVILGLKHYGRDDETPFTTEQKNVLTGDPIADPELMSDYILEKTAEPFEGTAREFKKLVYGVLTTPATELHPELETPGFGYAKLVVTPLVKNLAVAVQAEQKALRAHSRAEKALEQARSDQDGSEEKKAELTELETRAKEIAEEVPKIVTAREETEAALAGEVPEYQSVIREESVRKEHEAAKAILGQAQQELEAAEEAGTAAQQAYEDAKALTARKQAEFGQAHSQAQTAARDAKQAKALLEQATAEVASKTATQDGSEAKATELAEAKQLEAQLKPNYDNAVLTLKELVGVRAQKESELRDAGSNEQGALQAHQAAQAAAADKKTALTAAEGVEKTAREELTITKKAADEAKAKVREFIVEEAKAVNLAKEQEDAFKTALAIHGDTAVGLDTALQKYDSNVTNFKLKALLERVDLLLAERAPLDVFATPFGSAVQMADPTAGLAPEIANAARIMAAVDALKAQQAGRAAVAPPAAAQQIPPQLAKERQALQHKKDIFERKVAKFEQDIEAAQLPEQTKTPLREIAKVLKDHDMAAVPIVAKLTDRQGESKIPGYSPLDYQPIRKAASLAMKKREEEELRQMDEKHSHDEITHKQWVLVSTMVEAAEQMEGERFPTIKPMGRFKRWFMRNFASPGDGLVNLFKWLYKWTGLRGVFGDNWMAGPRMSSFFGVREGTSGLLSKDKRGIWRHKVDEHGVKMPLLNYRVGFWGALKLAGIVFSAFLAFVPVLRAYWLRAPWEMFCVAYSSPEKPWYEKFEPWRWRLNPPASDRTLHNAPTIEFMVRTVNPFDKDFWVGGNRKQVLGDAFPWNWDWSGPQDPTNEELRKYSYNDNYVIPERLANRVDPESEYFAGEDFFTSRYGVGHMLPGEKDDSNAKARLEWLRRHPDVLRFLDERDRLSRVVKWELLDEKAKIPDNDKDDKNNKPVCATVNNGKNVVCHPLWIQTEPLKDGWKLNERVADEFIEALRALDTQHTAITYDYLNSNLQLWKHDGYLIKKQEAALMDWAGLDTLDDARFLMAQPQAITLLAPLLSRGESQLYLETSYRDEFIAAWREEIKKAVPNVDAMFQSVSEDAMKAAFDATVAGVKAGPMTAMLVDCTEDYNRRLVMDDVEKIRMEMGIPSLAQATVDALVQHSELREFFLKFTVTDAAEELEGATFDEFVGDWLLPLVESDPQHAAEKLEEFDPFTTPQGSRVQWAERYEYMRKVPLPPATGEAAAPAEEGATPPLSDEAKTFYGNAAVNGGLNDTLRVMLDSLYEATGTDGEAMRRAYGSDRVKTEEAVRAELYRMLTSAGQNDGDATTKGDIEKCRMLGITVTGTGDAMKIEVNGRTANRGLRQYILTLVSRPPPASGDSGSPPASGTQPAAGTQQPAASTPAEASDQTVPATHQ